MEAMDGLYLNEDGTIDVWIDEQKIHLRRPKLGQFRDLVAMLDVLDAQWTEAVQSMVPEKSEDIPEHLSISAADAAEADFRQTHGREPRTAAERTERQARGAEYLRLLMMNRLMSERGEMFAQAWVTIIETLRDSAVAVMVNDLPAWAANPVSLQPLRDHWMNVPLHLGPASDRAESNGQAQSQATTTS